MASEFSKKMLWLKGNVVAVTIDDKAMVIDFDKQDAKKHFTLGPESGCFMLELLARSPGKEVMFEELVDCVTAQFAFGSGQTPEEEVDKFLKSLRNQGVLGTSDGIRTLETRQTPTEILKKKMPDTKQKWDEVKLSTTGGSGVWVRPTWYP